MNLTWGAKGWIGVWEATRFLSYAGSKTKFCCPLSEGHPTPAEALSCAVTQATAHVLRLAEHAPAWRPISADVA